MKIRNVISVAVLLAASAQTGAHEPPPRGGVGEVFTTTFRVEAVDPAARMVTLKDAGGWTRTFHVGPRVNNLDQVNAGDVVKASYMQSVAVELKKGGSGIRMSTTEEDVRGAKAGSKPEGVAERLITLVGTVEKVDRKAQLVTLKGPAGNLVEIAVPDAAKLRAVKVGDEVEAVYTEAIAVAVTAPTRP